MSTFRQAVQAYGDAAKDLLDGTGDPEAAIRTPLEGLLSAVAGMLGRKVVQHSESRLNDLHVRPDYAIRVDGVICGYVEVKRPGAPIDPALFTRHNLRQWGRLKDLPNLLYTNGTQWRLYRDGELLGDPTTLIGDLASAGPTLDGDVDSLERLLRDFLQWRPAPIRSVQALVRAVAPLCRLLRQEVVDQVAREKATQSLGGGLDGMGFTGLAKDWRSLLFPTAPDETFADGYAQAVTFALLLARSQGIEVSGTSMHAVGRQLGTEHSLMGRALQLLTDDVGETFRVSLDLLARVIGSVDWDAIRTRRADAYLHLYEHFLEEYDDDLRKASGSYYTPREVVDEMVRLVGDLLRDRLGHPEEFLSEHVTTVDPAMGTGTFLHAILTRAGEQAVLADGVGAAGAVVSDLSRRLIGFEMQMGPFAVAELRASDLLNSYGAPLPPSGLPLYVTNTLDDPEVEQTQLGATYAPIARSRREADRIKSQVPVTVVIGNPPYRERAEGQGGWVEAGRPGEGKAPLDAFRADGNGRYEYVLKNLYVYFWRWGTWKVFDAVPDDRAGVVCFISTAGYLRGPGFRGMREYLRRTCSRGWVIDCTPEGHQPDVATRLFPGVQQPLAIGIFVREPGTPDRAPADLRYTALTGRRAEKHSQLASLTLDNDRWRVVRSDWKAPFTPSAEGAWDDYPALDDLFPWTVPGVKPNRTWVYAPHPDILTTRWQRLVSEPDPDAKKLLFKESRDRKLDSVVDGLPGHPSHMTTIGQESGACPNPTRVAYRSFDRQWVVPDNRLFHGPSPGLWRAVTVAGQMFLSEQHAHAFDSGPGTTVSCLPVDMDHFNGRGGRVLPLFRSDGTANLGVGFTDAVAERIGERPDAHDVLAYVLGVVAHPAYTTRFTDELMTPGIRVPVTADLALWHRAVDLGRKIGWASTYGERFVDTVAGRPADDIRFAAGDPRRVVNSQPIVGMPATIEFDGATEVLTVGSGEFSPVPPAVWTYDVGGMPVVPKWFSYRKANAAGRRSSPLDDIHLSAWPAVWTSELNDLLSVLRHLVELEPAQAELLDEVVAGPLLSVGDISSSGTLPGV